jgi:hypothetical protein
MEHSWAKRVRSVLTPLPLRGLLGPLGGTGETHVADQLTAEKPKALARRRSLKVRDLDKELVLALAAANVSHLSERPRKAVRR